MKKTLCFFLLLLAVVNNGKSQTRDEIRLKYNNPDLVVDLGTGLWGTPIPVDYNKDGLMDIMVTCPDTPFRGVYIFLNIGTKEEPLFDIPQKLSDTTFSNVHASYSDGKLNVFRPGILYADFVNNLFDQPQKIDVDVLPGHDFTKIRSNMWSYVDYDNDGDQDIIVGIDDWGDYGWDNAFDKNGVWQNGPLRGYNPLDSWKKCYIQIGNLNRFIKEEPNITFSNDKEKDEKLRKRLIGEVYFLRAWYQFELLSRFSGPDDAGNMLGYPIVINVIDEEESKTIARSKFDDCVSQIDKDIAKAIENLPEKQYAGTDVVTGSTQIGRAYQLSALALRSRLFLYAASPAFSVSKSETEKQALWKKTAIASKEVIDIIGSLPAINVSGDIYANPNHAEIIWRSYQPDNNSPERENFYPSLWGNGRTNPSQSLVDAFPMKDGYPIKESSSYDNQNPYVNRDNRFTLSVLYNAASFGSDVVEIYEGGKDYEAGEAKRATRTGYYLRKFMDASVNIKPGETASTTKHYYAFFRSGEMWLNFAEAANEAWGTDQDPEGLGKTAKDAIAELRTRAGIVAGSQYLDEVVNAGKQEMAKLIQNERRIELCFENHRFFDVRRWLLPLNELNSSVEGVKVTKNNEEFTYHYGQIIESRKFGSHMYYGPLPEQVVYSSNGKIVQNKGW